MRLARLRISGYRNLDPVEIEFDLDQSLSVLIGRNGSGKSNLIEAIVEIFRELEEGSLPDFMVEMDYVCHGQQISVRADPSRRRQRMQLSVDGKPISRRRFLEAGSRTLPRHVFAYYSGWSDRLQRKFDRPTRKHYDQVLRSESGMLPLRRLFYCRKEYSQLVLLAFFLDQSRASTELLANYLGISRFESALFVLKKPWWGDSRAPRSSDLSDGDPRFWHARGAFRTLLDRLWAGSLAPIRATETIERDIRRRSEQTERLYLFIKDEEALLGLRQPGEATKTLFGYLESLFLCDLIDEVMVAVERHDGARMQFTEMSEGEQQLLTVLGLMLFTQDDESLYLLDEPDTHLNPVWTYEYLGLLDQSIDTRRGHVLVSTHNPLMIGGLHKSQVRALSWEGSSIAAREPNYDPIGLGVEGLLRSELYGLRSTLAPEVLERLDRHYELMALESPSDIEVAELRALSVELNSMAISRTHPNPYFSQFADALARRRPFRAPRPLTREQVAEQAEIADELLAEVLAEDTSGESP